MTELLTAGQMREIEQAAMARGAVSGLTLMERAGHGAVEAMFRAWPDLAQSRHSALVLCGPGNNGGDGFVIARLLRQRGWSVTLYLFGDATRLPPDAQTNCDRWREIGAVQPLDAVASDGPPVTLLVDALFGTGLTRPLGPDLAAPLQRGMTRADRVLAVDAPSGLCMDSGRVLGTDGIACRADLTVSFHAEKLGHRLADGPAHCGSVAVQDIGLAHAPDPAQVSLVTGAQGWAGLSKQGAAHKYGHGHALILTGGAGRTGAARLAARGALRIGAGLVTLGVPGAAQMEVAAQITALMLSRIDDAPALSAALEDDRLNALCLGPGLGLERAQALVPAALAAGPGRGVVLDADALTAFAEDPAALFGQLHPRCVLTPHAGEFARLFPDLAAPLKETPDEGPALSKVAATRAAARRAGCVVLFKGADTVIADPSGACAVHSATYDRAAPWLATAGAGDVLAGFIAGLLARGLAPMQAARTASWLHVEAARSFGPGLIAEDLPEALPRVLRGLR
ncbi:bifunctional ADP-dependent NAD(P)H-hydrate dehydratase/NAD(P)H-hydrate epimerase [Pseudoponticoccus marisrubri]|uniref:Bifunctional NAD(P)H-hydrate repair enzyme n=1 Tax=Pseudoponticoccus marisrubri TaxID=1685382 RepID=A0A0W7WEK6_9RHOB|nr:bifunctional ADP-dependent NAD(P)H-hydrate dehydratase/NAD(P)H-hydrate epimerase [Pseudoponticoccus marisrubri]KUF09052.1 bifunctional ADP-dependent (S)-NAD(P)H-hydrate dehydratase/NAD(P)H-hydrate epimerase [Pseudoponticoccus marisrubri]